jgi:hypothetical protein
MSIIITIYTFKTPLYKENVMAKKKNMVEFEVFMKAYGESETMTECADKLKLASWRTVAQRIKHYAKKVPEIVIKPSGATGQGRKTLDAKTIKDAALKYNCLKAKKK